jgi:pyruvate/2-oxoglutarate dehydrogenase complex dihydrolipoamide acyltransferase (E2) component
MVEFRLPDVGEGIHEGVLLSWMVRVGDEVEEGAPVAEVETDKVTVDLPAPAAGRVTELRVEEGAVVRVGEVLCVLEDGREAAVEPPASSASPAAPAPPAAAAPPASSAPAAAAPPAPSATATASGAPAVPAAERPLPGPVVAAPSTRRLAAELGVDLAQVTGTGPGGRILRQDVEQHEAAVPRPRAEAPTGVRRAMFERMQRSASLMATSTSTFEVDADGVLELLELVASGPGGRQLSPLVVVAAAVARTLERHPRLNATVDEERRELRPVETVNLGIAVAAPQGLLVPVLRSASSLRLLAVADELQRLTTAAVEGRLGPADMAGGSFTLSSTGGMERARMLSTTPIINHPQVATMWVSRFETRPRVRDGALEAGPVGRVSVSFDHRLIDGAEITHFINDLAALLEQPGRMLA